MTIGSELVQADVTVVIPTFNRAQYIAFSIDSILAQTARPQRIVVVDDGSTDDTRKVLAPYQDTIEVFHRENAGKMKALNWVLPSIKTQYVWFFDDDDVALPQALSDLVNAFCEDSELGFTFGDRFVSKAEGPLRVEESVHRPYRFPKDVEHEQRLQLYHDCTIMMSGSLLRTQAVKQVGGLDETLDRSEDYDLMVRLASKYRFKYCGKPVYILRRHPGPRGALGAQHQSHATHRQWARYNRQIGFYIRYCIPLGSLATVTNNSSCPPSYREALINRAWILANKLPLSYAITDVEEACKLSPRTPLTKNEALRLLEAMTHDFTLYQGRFPLFRTLSLTLSHCGADAAVSLSKSLFWRARGVTSKTARWSLYLRASMIFGLGQIARQYHRAASSFYNPKVSADR